MEETKNTASWATWDEEGVEAGRFDALRDIIATLRSENGCPWDREQTFESLKPSLADEAAEVIGAIDIYDKTGDSMNLVEELGDMMMLTVLLAQLASDEGLFDIEDVIRAICRKMILRHPHVFGEEASKQCMPTIEDFPEDADTADGKSSGEASGRISVEEVCSRWDQIKGVEKKCYSPLQLRMQKEAENAAKAWMASYMQDKAAGQNEDAETQNRPKMPENG